MLSQNGDSASWPEVAVVVAAGACSWDKTRWESLHPPQVLRRFQNIRRWQLDDRQMCVLNEGRAKLYVIEQML